MTQVVRQDGPPWTLHTIQCLVRAAIRQQHLALREAGVDLDERDHGALSISACKPHVHHCALTPGGLRTRYADLLEHVPQRYRDSSVARAPAVTVIAPCRRIQLGASEASNIGSLVSFSECWTAGAAMRARGPRDRKSVSESHYGFGVGTGASLFQMFDWIFQVPFTGFQTFKYLPRSVTCSGPYVTT